METASLALRKTYALFLILLLAAGMASCGTDKVTDGPPVVPPQDALLIDFSSFPTSAPVLRAGNFATTLGQSNYNFAAGNVAVWNFIITVGLAVPVGTFLESFNHLPVKQPDGSWLWSYNKTVGTDSYDAKLNGKFENGLVTWNMYVSKLTGTPYANFNWFTGTADWAATQGAWIMRQSPDNPVDMLQIDWHRNAAAGTSDITYTNVVPNGPENGGYIAFGKTDGTPYNAYYNIYNKGADSLINIEWNRTTKEGRAKNLTAFGDENWHYWDSALADVP